MHRTPRLQPGATAQARVNKFTVWKIQQVSVCHFLPSLGHGGVSMPGRVLAVRWSHTPCMILKNTRGHFGRGWSCSRGKSIWNSAPPPQRPAALLHTQSTSGYSPAAGRKRHQPVTKKNNVFFLQITNQQYHLSFHLHPCAVQRKVCL